MLQAALIGCGAVVDELYVLPLRRLAKAGVLQIVALVDPDAGRAERLRRQLGTGSCYPDFESAARATSITATLIASPPSWHERHALAALAAGSHVYCEKPIANSAAEARRMVEAADRAGRLLGIGMARRFYPNVAEIAQRVARGDLGEPIEFSFREGGLYGWPIKTEAPFRRATSSGGVLLDVGAHALDLLSWVFGTPTVVRCEDDALPGGVEATARLELAFPKARGVLQLSWDQPLNSGFHLRGPRGEIRMNNLEIIDYEFRPAANVPWQTVRSQAHWPSAAGPRVPPTGQPLCYYDCFDYELVAFCRSILHGEPLAVSGATAAGILDAIDHAYAMATPLPQAWLGPVAATAAQKRHWRQAPAAVHPSTSSRLA